MSPGLSIKTCSFIFHHCREALGKIQWTHIDARYNVGIQAQHKATVFLLIKSTFVVLVNNSSFSRL